MFQDIQLSKLIPSKFNYRQHMDETALEELTASVKSKGILQPILVRPLNGKQKGKYEIVAGHRRHQAALSAGLKQMPAMVKDLTDEEALEVQVIENTQREDPNPMDEALGFKRLLDMGKHTPETLADKIGHSVKYVLARTRLLGLAEEVKDVIAAGELSLGHALLISRLKNHADQKKLMEIVRSNDGMTVKQATARMGSFSCDLSDADFALDDCEKCTARTRNQADLFPALKDAADECMDKECYYDKTLVHWGNWLDGYAEKGFQAINNEDEMPKMWGNGRGESAARIVFSPDGKEWNEEYPPKYATKCAKCKKHHAFYAYEKSYGSGIKEIEHGELCLNIACLDEMLKKAAPKEKGRANAPEAEQGMGSWQKSHLAEQCLKRFLTSQISEKMAIDSELKQRVEVAALFACLLDQGNYDDFIEEFLPGYDEDADEYPLYELDHAWEVLKGISVYRLDKAKAALIREQFKFYPLPFVKAVAIDADIDAPAEFSIDEKYLAEFEGQDLRNLVAELWPDEDQRPLILRDISDDDDENIRSLILAQDLKGRLPKEMVIQVEEEEGDGSKNTCDECGEKGEDCMCVGGPDLSGADAGEEKGDETGTPAPEDDPTMPQPTKTGRKRKK